MTNKMCHNLMQYTTTPLHLFNIYYLWILSRAILHFACIRLFQIFSHNINSGFHIQSSGSSQYHLLTFDESTKVIVQFRKRNNAYLRWRLQVYYLFFVGVLRLSQDMVRKVYHRARHQNVSTI